MRRRFSNKYGREIYEIFTGEYYVTNREDIIMQTLLGSCIAVCLRDNIVGVTGINHFMLPGKANLEKIEIDEDARYGINSMELMINAMMKKGASRTRLEAKVFGGGKVMKAGLNNVAENNVGFITRYLEIEEIPVIASDVGGKHGRKIILLPGSFSVYVRKIKKHKLVNETVAEEKKLLSKVKNQKKEKSNITYFAQGDK